MRPTQTDERIEADIDEIVAELLGEDATSTTQAIVRSETPAESGTPSDATGDSSGNFLGGVIGFLFWPLMIALAAGGAYLIVKFVLAGPARSASKSNSVKVEGRKKRTAKKFKVSNDLAKSQEQGVPLGSEEQAKPSRPPLPYEVEQWLEKALVAERQGEFREAVRCRYRALIALLAHRKLVDETETTTVGEYLLEVHASTPGNLRTFASAAGMFELAWYTDRSLELEQSQDMERLFDQMAEATR